MKSLEDKARERMSGPGPWLVALALWLVVAVVSALALWHLRVQSLDAQKRELALLSLALTDELERGLQGAEDGLHAMREELTEKRLSAEGSETARALATRAELMPLVDSLWLVDRDRRVLSASDAGAMPDLSSFVPGLQSLANGTVAISRPFTDTKTQRAQIGLAMRSSEPGGGWLIATLPADALLGAFSAATPAPDARMAVFRSDGERLAGSLTDRATLDGSEHLVSIHKLPHFGLELVITRHLHGALAQWREATRFAGIALLLLAALMAVAMRFVQRAYHHRAEARRALQAQAARASKLEALGGLAGGVAHDFNNVLAAIIGFGEMAQDEAPKGSDQARQLDKVLQAALRGKALVERILSFSRGGARSSEVFALEPVVDEVLGLLAASLRPGIVLQHETPARDGRVRGDPTQAFEAVMNLCTNAMQAMPGGGTVVVRLAREQVDDERLLSHSRLAPGRWLALSVTDEGGGIAPEVMDRLFEPFFTTRAAESGTGLGLAVVHGVVAEFGGAIDVQSVQGQGARFTLYLPEVDEAAPVDKAGHAAESPGRGEALLVVDDEPDLVALAEETLRSLGYAPVGFTDAAAALQALLEAPRRFAAVITDEVMPGLSGTQLTQSLRAHAPDIPVLLVSGYGGALLAQRAAAVGVTRVLAKPLQRAELARALAELLRA
jgi:signal transduction histidine kinase/ActR/RegA family two-component response regulator